MLTRVLLCIIGVPYIPIGFYALLAPRHFYEQFPFGRGWVAAEPAYSTHLVTDVGGALASGGVLLVFAAVWLERRLLTAAAVSWLVFAVPHMTFHLDHIDKLSSELSVGDAIGEGFLVVSAVAVPLMLLVLQTIPQISKSSTAILNRKEQPVNSIEQQLSIALGARREIELSTACIPYHETGSGRPVVFIHGYMVNPATWRGVVPSIAAAGFRCISPELPLGGHSQPAPRADLSSTGVADLIKEFLERLNLDDVTIVANDSGGAITTVAMARGLPQVSRLVLATPDCYTDYPPPTYAWMPAPARWPGGRLAVWSLVELMRIRALQRLPITFGRTTKRPIPPPIMDHYLSGSRYNPAIRADLRRFISEVKPSYTLDAAREFPNITIPVLIAWANENKIIPPTAAERMARDFPNATLKWVPDGHMLIQEDQPELLADIILDFMSSSEGETGNTTERSIDSETVSD